MTQAQETPDLDGQDVNPWAYILGFAVERLGLVQGAVGAYFVLANETKRLTMLPDMAVNLQYVQRVSPESQCSAGLSSL
jgi:hypothetical protein